MYWRKEIIKGERKLGRIERGEDREKKERISGKGGERNEKRKQGRKVEGRKGKREQRVRKSDDVRQKYYKTIRLSVTLMRMKLK